MLVVKVTISILLLYDNLKYFLDNIKGQEDMERINSPAFC
jgi:hypothetical protein